LAKNEVYTSHIVGRKVKQAAHVATRYAPPFTSPCGRRSASRRRATAAPADVNVATVSHAQYVSTLTAAAVCA